MSTYAYPIESYGQLAPPDYETREAQPWEDREVTRLAALASLGAYDLWHEYLAEYPLSLRTWEDIIRAHRDTWVEFDIELADLAQLTLDLGSFAEAEAALNTEFSS